MVKQKITRALYQSVIKPTLFQFDAELVHDCVTFFGEKLENQQWLIDLLFSYKKDSFLTKKVLGLNFENLIGLAAGFDYNGHLAKIMRYIGFGFNTVGTVTAKASDGNKPPRLGRLPKSKALLVNKGFKSDGAKIISKRLDKKNLKKHMIGISVGSSNIPSVNTLTKAIEDYLITFNIFKDKAYTKYFELNISCPNTAMTESFLELKNFRELVSAVSSIGVTQPIFIKMPNEISLEESDNLVAIALAHDIRGFIFSNLVKDRNNKAFDMKEIKWFKNWKGNFSGKPAAEGAMRLLGHTREKFGSDIALVSLGGIFSAKDAWERLEMGADLIQIVTGLIYEGPQVVNEIKEGIKTKNASVTDAFL